MRKLPVSLALVGSLSACGSETESLPTPPDTNNAGAAYAAETGVACDVLIVGDGLGAVSALLQIMDGDTGDNPSGRLCWAPEESHLGGIAVNQMPNLDGVNTGTAATFMSDRARAWLTATANLQGAPWNGIGSPGGPLYSDMFGALPGNLEAALYQQLPWDPTWPSGQRTLQIGSRDVTVFKDTVVEGVDIAAGSPPAITGVHLRTLKTNAAATVGLHDGIGLYTCNREDPDATRYAVTARLVIDATDLGDVGYLVEKQVPGALQPHPASPDQPFDQAFSYTAMLSWNDAAGPTNLDVAGARADEQAWRSRLDGAFRRYNDWGWNSADAQGWWRYRRIGMAGQGYVMPGGTGATLAAQVTALNVPASDHLNDLGNTDNTSLLYRADGSWRDPTSSADQREGCAILRTARRRARATAYYGALAADPHALHATYDENLETNQFGLARSPYVRDGRHLAGFHVLTKDDITSRSSTVRFTDSLGYATYTQIDVHADTEGPYSDGGGGAHDGGSTPIDVPAAVPLSALVARNVKGLVAGGKLISVDHDANGYYRHHLPELAIGAAAGQLASAFLHGTGGGYTDPYTLAHCVSVGGCPAAAVQQLRTLQAQLSVTPAGHHNHIAMYANLAGHACMRRPYTAPSHLVYGAIFQHYIELCGREDIGFGGLLGDATSDELDAGDQRGRYNTFEQGVMYWSPTTGAHEVHGSILTAWQQRGGMTGGLGYPISDEQASVGGRCSNFEHGSLYWSQQTYRVTYSPEQCQ